MATKTESRTSAKAWTQEEKDAMQERARELKAHSRRRTPEEERAAGEQELQAKVAELPEDERAMAEAIHAIVSRTAPQLAPRTYYGMPAWAKDGKVLLFFQPAAKFKSRYSTLGFNDDARLDDGAMWPTSWALTRIGPKEEARITELVRRAVD